MEKKKYIITHVIMSPGMIRTIPDYNAVSLRPEVHDEWCNLVSSNAQIGHAAKIIVIW